MKAREGIVDVAIDMAKAKARTPAQTIARGGAQGDKRHWRETMNKTQAEAVRQSLIAFARTKRAPAKDGGPHTTQLWVPVSIIERSRTAAQERRRTVYDADKAAELLASVRKHGILQPLLARVVLSEPPRVELVAGERRLEAAKAAKLKAVPCVVARDMDDGRALEAQLVENLQRQGLDPLAEAEGLAALRDAGLSAAESAKRVGRSKSHVLGRLKLLDLCPEGRAALDAGEIEATTALLLARLPADRQPRLVKSVSGRTHWEAKNVVMNSAPDVSDPPWDVEREGMIVMAAWHGDRAPSCSACPRRAGNSGAPDDVDPWTCLDPDCFDGKMAVAVGELQEKWRAEGRTIAPENEVFDDWKCRAGWVNLNDAVRTGSGYQSIGNFVGGDDVHYVARPRRHQLSTSRVAKWDVVRAAIEAKGGGIVDGKGRDGNIPGPRNPRDAQLRKDATAERNAHVRGCLQQGYRAAMKKLIATGPAADMLLVPRELAVRLAESFVDDLHPAAIQWWQANGGDPAKRMTALSDNELALLLEDCAASAEGVLDEWCRPPAAKAVEMRCAAAGLNVKGLKAAARKSFKAADA